MLRRPHPICPAVDEQLQRMGPIPAAIDDSSGTAQLWFTQSAVVCG